MLSLLLPSELRLRLAPGLLILSTTRGLRSDRDARRFNVGGEILRGIR